MKGEHHYQVAVTAGLGAGTELRAYGRDHLIGAAGKADIAGSADPASAATRRAGTRKICWWLRSAPVINYGICICAPPRAFPCWPYQDNAVGVMREDAARGFSPR